MLTRKVLKNYDLSERRIWYKNKNMQFWYKNHVLPTVLDEIPRFWQNKNKNSSKLHHWQKIFFKTCSNLQNLKISNRLFFYEFSSFQILKNWMSLVGIFSMGIDILRMGKDIVIPSKMCIHYQLVSLAQTSLKVFRIPSCELHFW